MLSLLQSVEGKTFEARELEQELEKTEEEKTQLEERINLEKDINANLIQRQKGQMHFGGHTCYGNWALNWIVYIRALRLKSRKAKIPT